MNRNRSSVFITRGQEQPPLEYGPQRIHYIYSVGIPQAYLTLFSILQGLVFSFLLPAIPLPQALTWPEIWSLVSQHYLYLPYLISSGMVVLIWIHLVSITLTGGWPNSFLQVSLITLLTIFEICLAQKITNISLWLFFAGCIGIMGGIILIRTATIRQEEDFHPSIPFQNFGRSLQCWETSRGKHYILIGLSIALLSLFYNRIVDTLKSLNPSLASAAPWAIYISVLLLLCVLITSRAHRNKSHRKYEKRCMQVPI